MKGIQSKGDTFYQLNLRQSTKGSVQCVFLFLFEVRNLFRQFTEKVIHNPSLFMKVTTVWVPVYALSESNQNVSFRGLLYLALDFSVPLTSGPHPSLICVLCMVEYYFWGRGVLYQKFERCQELDLSNTGSLYKKVPLRFFQFLRILDMKGTAISTEDLGKVAKSYSFIFSVVCHLV